MISISRSRARDGSRHTVFYPYAPQNLDELAALIATEVWSPINFKDNYRLKANFVSARLVALDFDDGALTVADAVAYCREMEVAHVIGTTKSHMKEKVSPTGRVLPACDRFRMVFVAAELCSLREVYEYNMRRAISAWRCDSSCKDGARFFYPCAEIVSVGRGLKWQWAPLPADYVTDAQVQERARARAAAYRAAGILPRWLSDILRGVTPVEAGERHKTCYRLGATLALYGWTAGDTVAALLQTDLRDIGEKDLERAVANGYRAAGEDLGNDD